MTVVNTFTDPDALTMTLVAEFDASVDRVWEVWADARKLERWWGPPMWPATFTRHDFVPGGQSRYFMTGPTGEMHHGWWRTDVLNRPHRIEFANGLAGDDGEPAPGIEPMGAQVTLEELDGVTRVTTVTLFTDVEQMQAMLTRGMREGMIGAAGQIDELLAPVAAG